MLGFTQKALASASGVGQSEISRIERGEINPTIQTLARLLRPLGARLAVTPVDPMTGREVARLTRDASRTTVLRSLTRLAEIGVL